MIRQLFLHCFPSTPHTWDFLGENQWMIQVLKGIEKLCGGDCHAAQGNLVSLVFRAAKHHIRDEVECVFDCNRRLTKVVWRALRGIIDEFLPTFGCRGMCEELIHLVADIHARCVQVVLQRLEYFGSPSARSLLVIPARRSTSRFRLRNCASLGVGGTCIWIV